MIAEWLTRRVTLPLGDRRWPIIITHRVLLACEEITGADMLAASMGTVSASVLRALLFLVLGRAGAPYTPEECGAMFTPRTIPGLRRILTAAWAASMPEPEAGSAAGPRRTKRFTWLDAWSAARYDLRLTDDEWLDMTPRMLAALKAAHLGHMQREEWLVGVIASTSANFSGRCSKSVTPESFMLHRLPDAPEEQITGEYIMAQMSRKKNR